MNPLAQSGLDLRAVAGVAVALFLPWALLVIVFALRGQPGAVCLTPVAWLLAVVAGRGVLNFTRSTDPAKRRAEAGLAGGLLGGLLGMLLTVMLQIMGEITSQERLTLALLGVAATLGGLLVCTILAFALAALAERGGAKPG